MGRVRTVNEGLPRHLSRDSRTGGLRYKRPDTQRQVYLSDMPEADAIAIAEVVTAAFGTKPPRGHRYLYRHQFQSFDWPKVPRHITQVVAVKFADILPLQRGMASQEKVRHSWAYELPPDGALRKGLDGIRVADAQRVGAGMAYAARKNAKARGIAFDLTDDQVAAMVIAAGGRCMVTGIKLSLDRGELPTGRRMRRPWAPSLDRIDSSRGYSPDNCRVVCCAANYAMSQWGEDVLLEMAKAIARKRIKRMDAA